MEITKEILATYIQKAKEGNQGSFNFLLHHFWSNVYNYQLKRTHNENDAEDITIQSFSKAFDKINTFNEGYLSPYAHYLNVRNHIYLIKKHSFFNSIGSWTYQILKITSYSIYFILRGRFGKLKMVWRGLLDGIKFKKINLND